MIRVIVRVLFLFLMAAMIHGSAAAQDTSAQTGDASSQTPAGDTQQAGPGNSSGSQTGVSTTQIPTLAATASTVSSVPEYRSFFSYGVAVSQGESVPTVANQSYAGWFTLVQPQFEYLVATRKLHFALSSTPTIAYFPGRDTFTTLNGIFDPTAEISIQLTPRWSWVSLVNFSAGDQAARLFTSQEQSCDGDVCSSSNAAGLPSLEEHDRAQSLEPALVAPTPAAIDLAPFDVSNLVVTDINRNFADVAGFTGLRWERTRTETIGLTVGNSYSILDDYNVASARLQGSQLVNPTTTVTSYGQVHQYEGDDFHCVTYGIGAGAAHQFGRATMISGEAGPEYGSRSCGQRLGLYFEGSAVTRFSEKTTGSISVGRDLDAVYLDGNRWFDTFLARVDTRIEKNVYADLSGGYFHTGGPLNSTSSFSGFTFSPQVRWQINPSLDLIASYHYYERSLTPTLDSGSALNRGFAIITLSWHPSHIRF